MLSVILQENVYSSFAVPPPILIVATVEVLDCDTFCIVSEVAELDAVANVWPAAIAVLVFENANPDSVEA